ncbi:MAG: hypothetical protein K0U19_01475 [Proteobacteria bacterium]|nr:hypothetical protein [Pseudomonadota bacterium]
MIDTYQDDNIVLASRNLPGVRVQNFSYLLLTDLLYADVILFSERSINRCVEVWA